MTLNGDCGNPAIAFKARKVGVSDLDRALTRLLSHQFMVFDRTEKGRHPRGYINKIVSNLHKTMKSADNRRQETMEELFGEILFSGQMTRIDRCKLRTALLGNALSEDHLDIINRLLYSTKRGRLSIKD